MFLSVCVSPLPVYAVPLYGTDILTGAQRSIEPSPVPDIEEIISAGLYKGRILNHLKQRPTPALL